MRDERVREERVRDEQVRDGRLWSRLAPLELPHMPVLRPIVVHIAAAALATCALPCDVFAQAPIAVSQAEARSHLTGAPAPRYPRIAQAAAVTGTANVAVTIAVDGTVSLAEVAGGPPMLRNAAAEGVSAWRFRPFLGADGQPVTVSTMMTVQFGVSLRPEALQVYVDHGDRAIRCTTLVDAGQFTQALPICVEALTRAGEVPPIFNQNAAVPVSYTQLLIGIGRPDDALAFLNQAERAYPRVNWSAKQWAAAHLVRARVHQQRSNLAEAAQQVEEAYNAMDRLREALPRPSAARTDAVAHQQRIAAEWAEVLTQLGRQSDADRVLSRAKELR